MRIKWNQRDWSKTKPGTWAKTKVKDLGVIWGGGGGEGWRKCTIREMNQSSPGGALFGGNFRGVSSGITSGKKGSGRETEGGGSREM